MEENQSPYYAEFVYEKRAEGKLRLAKHLLVFGYVLFALLYFLFCYLTRLIPLFAIYPILAWMLVFFTWRYVRFDVYYAFNHGEMDFGKVKVSKRSKRRSSCLKVSVKDAILIAPYAEVAASEEYASVRRIYDFSSHSSSPTRLGMIIPSARGRALVIFESSPVADKLIRLYCKNTRGI